MKRPLSPLSPRPEQGFTLIELSIVLVIIGLLVGGILVGQDLIKAAEIRSTISQIDSYNAAINTFRGKYNGLPGDLLSATNYFTSVSNQGTGTGLGDGNGAIEASAAGKFDGETVVAWYEMSQAGLVGDAVGVSNFTDGATNLINTPATIPLAKLGQGGMAWTLATNLCRHGS